MDYISSHSISPNLRRRINKTIEEIDIFEKMFNRSVQEEKEGHNGSQWKTAILSEKVQNFIELNVLYEECKKQAVSDDNRGGDSGPGHSNEVAQLKAEHARLARLKDEVDRLKRRMKRATNERGGLDMAAANSPAQFMLYVVVGLHIALVSLLVGKFVL